VTDILCGRFWIPCPAKFGTRRFCAAGRLAFRTGGGCGGILLLGAVDCRLWRKFAGFFCPAAGFPLPATRANSVLPCGCTLFLIFFHLLEKRCTFFAPRCPSTRYLPFNLAMERATDRCFLSLFFLGAVAHPRCNAFSHLATAHLPLTLFYRGDACL